MAGIERSDSLVLDPHKGLFLPYGTGALLVRDGEALKRAHALSARLHAVDAGGPGPRGFQPALAGALARLPGTAGLAAAQDARRRPVSPQPRGEARPGAPRRRGAPAGCPGSRSWPSRSSRSWRSGWSEPGLDAAALDAPEPASCSTRINGSKRVYLTGTRLSGRFAIRICVLSFRTHRDRMDAGLEDIRAAAAESRGAF